MNVDNSHQISFQTTTKTFFFFSSLFDCFAWFFGYILKQSPNCGLFIQQTSTIDRERGRERNDLCLSHHRHRYTDTLPVSCTNITLCSAPEETRITACIALTISMTSRNQFCSIQFIIGLTEVLYCVYSQRNRYMPEEPVHVHDVLEACTALCAPS